MKEVPEYFNAEFEPAHILMLQDTLCNRSMDHAECVKDGCKNCILDAPLVEFHSWLKAKLDDYK